MIRNATEFVTLVENRLGFDLYSVAREKKQPQWKALSLYAGLVNKAIKKDPTLYTWANLELAVEYLHRHKRGVRSPVGVLYFVPDALAYAADPESDDGIGIEVQDAIEDEMSRPKPSQTWIGRLTRAEGSARREVLAAWRSARC